MTKRLKNSTYDTKFLYYIIIAFVGVIIK